MIGGFACLGLCYFPGVSISEIVVANLYKQSMPFFLIYFFLYVFRESTGHDFQLLLFSL